MALKLQAGSGMLRDSLDITEDAPVREFVPIHGSFSELASREGVDLHFSLRAIILDHWVKQSILSPVITEPRKTTMEKSAQKKPYVAPQLSVHGTVADLTQLLLVEGNLDNVVDEVTRTEII